MRTISCRLLALCFLALIAGTLRAGDDHIVFEGKAGPGAGKHIVFLAGDEEYRSEEALPMLAKILAVRHGFKCTVLFSVDPDGTINPDAAKSLKDNPNIEVSYVPSPTFVYLALDSQNLSGNKALSDPRVREAIHMAASA